MTEQKKRGRKKKESAGLSFESDNITIKSSDFFSQRNNNTKDPWMDVIPNCAKCEWFGINKTLTRKSEYRCLAQGCQLTSEVYGTANCRKNYEEKN